MRRGLRQKIKHFPDTCGVYVMKDAGGKIIYIGKAASLKKRAATYFSKTQTSPKIQSLIEAIKDIEYIQTSSIEQALMLEALLVKKHRPRYNVDLKDDKSFPFIKISKESYPRVFIGRGIEKGIIYYGPYTQVKILRAALKGVRKIFPFRSCAKFPKKPCLYYQLKLCAAPCVGKIDRITYREDLNQLRMLLEGRHSELLSALKRRMHAYSDVWAYEAAARVCNQITNLKKIIFHTAESLLISVLPEMKEVLKLPRLPVQVEAIDVSNTYGVYACGSVARFKSGHPDKDNYRRFRIKTFKGIDDYRMIREVVQRRYLRLKEEKKELPDLIMIDGGRGHLNVAKAELEKLKLKRVSVIAIAKKNEDIYLPDGSKLSLLRNSEVLHYIQRIRDEAHRFAIGYHRKMREKPLKKSRLDEIEGIGKARKTKLIRRFGSINQLKKATAEEIAKIGGMGKNLARKILKELE